MTQSVPRSRCGEPQAVDGVAFRVEGPSVVPAGGPPGRAFGEVARSGTASGKGGSMSVGLGSVGFGSVGLGSVGLGSVGLGSVFVGFCFGSSSSPPPLSPPPAGDGAGGAVGRGRLVVGIDVQIGGYASRFIEYFT